ncbi:MAG: DNA repair protein RecN [Ruminococcaceae bacterium]|nr:DNA repair protein RecN [Oscillospiraceae bacterium]
MLFTLHIRNIALLDDVEIEFQEGFNVLTGETGAGKSILISSINLLLGERARHEMIRSGEERAEVSGLFYVQEPVLSELTEMGYAVDEDGALLLSRQILRDGKNICKIAGHSVTLSDLKQVGQKLVNIHGQRDSQALLDATKHIHFLDGFLKEEGRELLTAYQQDYKNWKKLQLEVEQLDIDEAEKLRKIDLLTYEIDEIKAANLIPGEEEELKRKRDMANHKKRLEHCVAGALTALSDGEEGAARDGLAVASDGLAEAAEYDDSLSDCAERLQGLLEEAEEVTRELRSYYEQLAEEELPIDDIEARLDVIYRLKRKYGQTVEEVLLHLEESEKELLRLENAEAQAEELMLRLQEAEVVAQKSAQRLTDLRKNAVAAIEVDINENLHFLNMAQADFSIAMEEVPLHLYGAERITFMIQTNSGEEHKPLGKIVSGGELSRITLAIKSVLTDGDDASTLIFDEIDTGVSGMAAQKIGRKLRDLSANKQVLCVTHLAQIAAMASSHFLIEKQTENDRTRTEVVPLSHEVRLQELARMISGEAVTETTLRQAEELIRFGDKHD